MNIDDFSESKYLQKTDFPQARTLTIKGIEVKNVAKQNEAPENKPVAFFNEFEKGVVLNKTNREAIAAILGSRDTDHWVGKQITLYNDPTVSYAGKTTGGIRVQYMPQAAPVPAPALEQPPIDMGEVPF